MSTAPEPGAESFRKEFDLADDQPFQRPVVRLCNLILAEALLSQAQAVRLQSLDAEHGGVEYQRNGAWQVVMRVDLASFGPMIDRLKDMAALDVERREAQQGDLRVRYKNMRRVLAVRTGAGTSPFEFLTITRFADRAT